MKKCIFRLALAAVFVSTIISCQKNDDSTPTPTPGTPTLDRDKFITTTGNPWQVESHHSPSAQVLFWGLDILAGSSTSEIYLDNLDQMGAGYHATASVNGSTFTIPQQTVIDHLGNSNIYKGSGTYSGGNLSFNYTVDDGTPNIDTVTATAHR